MEVLTLLYVPVILLRNRQAVCQEILLKKTNLIKFNSMKKMRSKYFDQRHRQLKVFRVVNAAVIDL